LRYKDLQRLLVNQRQLKDYGEYTYSQILAKQAFKNVRHFYFSDIYRTSFDQKLSAIAAIPCVARISGP